MTDRQRRRLGAVRACGSGCWAISASVTSPPGDRSPQAGAAARARTLQRVGPAAKPVAAKPAGPVRRVKELVGKRTANSRFFALSDGRVQAELGAGPVNYRDAKGRWQPIDTRIVPLDRNGFAFGSVKNRFGSLFGRTSDQLLRFEQGGRQVTMGLPGAVTTLTPRVQGDTITYPGALEGGADLVWRVTPQGIKEQIVLSGPPPAATWRFSLRLGGVVARAQPDGSIAFVAKQGGDVPLWVMPKPFMTDAADDASSPYGKGYSEQVTQTVAQHGDQIQVTVRANPAWLGAAERRWPVVVDPTIEIQPITWEQSDDVEIRSEFPTDNLDALWQLAVGTTAAGRVRSLIKFPLTDIPSGTQITTAQLQTWFDASHTVAPDNPVTIEARRVTAAWADTTATWNSINTAFAEAGLGTATRQANQSAAWHSFDVKNIVQTWLNGTQPNYGFMLKATDETLNRGGPIYEAAPGLASYGYNYGGETQNGPKLLVTYGLPSVNLAAPSLITATGAQLSWLPYVDPTPGSVPEDDLVEYQVHRRLNGSSTTTPTCGPLSWAWCRYSSRVAVLPSGTTSYLDTSAPPTPVDDPSPQGKAYDYWVVAKTRDGQASASGVQVAWLPKAGRTKLILQGSALDTTLSSTQSTTGHDVFDGRPWLGVGNNSTTYGKTRTLLKFDTTTIPTNATVLDTDLSLWHPLVTGTAGANATYNLHKLTKAFDEATASWTWASPFVSWTSPGGDYSATTLGSVTGLNNDEEPKWRTWRGANLTSTVQGWAATPSTNLGFLLKLANEASTAERSLFLSSEVGEPLLRPRLTITYTQRTPANTYHAPATPERMTAGDTTTMPVTVTNTTAQTLWAAGSCPLDQYKASYFANQTLSGTPSGERCEGAIDNDWGTAGGPSGVGVGADNFSVRWVKTQGFAAGTYTFSATADDGVRVFLDGTPVIDQWKNQPPTTYTVSRVVAAGDHELKVEYYEGTGGAVAKFSVTAGGSCPVGQYQASYFANTTLSGTATGVRCEGAIDNDWGSGGPTGVGVGVDTFSVRWVKTQNFTAGTYTFTATADDGVRVFLDGALVIDQWKIQPPTTYTASRAVTAGSHEVKMEYFENAFGAVAKLGLRGAASQLTYKWLLPDDTGDADPASAASQLMTALPRDVPPGNTVTVNAQVKALSPADPGATRIDRVLTWDLYNQTTNTYLSAATGGVTGLGQHVGVEQPTSDELGLERFYQYAGKNTGAGSTVLVNQHSGNLVWSYNPLANPSRGPETFVRMTYNSLDTSTSSMGFGWSLSAASVMRLGTPLQFHPPGQDWPTTIRLTDGDGTTHTFTLNQHGSNDPAVWDYDHPLGVHLYLQKNSTTDAARTWVMTRPDRTKFYFDADGYQSATRDNNGNELLFTYDRRKSNNKPIKFLKYLTDAATRQTLTLDYYAKGQTFDYYDSTTNTKITASNLTNPFIIDQVSSITSISDASTPARTLKLTYSDKGLLKELVDGAGTTLAKTFLFDYDMTQGNRNVKLVKITDPRGNPTSLAYYDPPGDDPQFHWWAKTITDRRSGQTGIAYTDPDGPQGQTLRTVVTDALTHASTYVTDGFGRPTSATNAKSQVTLLGWDADHNVIRLEENNHAVTSWTYDPNTGYPLTMRDAQAGADNTPATTFGYQTSLNGHVADLTSKTSPEGRRWAFGYDTAGNLTTVTDPAGTATPTIPNDFQTTYTYDGLGQLQSATDANGNPTGYSSYDANGYPQTITDAKTKITRFVYDARGNVTKVTDPLGHDTTQTYDLFDRPLVHTEQKAPGELITTPAPQYDPNDNTTQATASNGAQSTYTYDPADKLTDAFAPKDTPAGPERKTTYDYDLAGNLTSQTEPNGNLTTTVGDFTTTYGHDQLNQLTSVTNAKGDKLTYAYDDVGNLGTVIDPKKTASADPTDFTTKYTYDLAHRQKTVTDAEGHPTLTDYDHDGNVVATTDQEGNKTLLTLDTRGKPFEVKVPRSGSGTSISYNITRYEYDQVGNPIKVTSPRGTATTATEDFAQQTTYDELNRVKEKILPFDPGDPRYNTADKLTYTYDDASRLTTVSAPPSQGQTVRNDTKLTYFDNGWVRTSSDPWDITTTYEYNPLGQQTARTTTSAGGSSSRGMTWGYFPDGKVQTRTDEGVPAGLQVVLVDNSDRQNTQTVGTWPVVTTPGAFHGIDYQTHAAGTGTNTFTWNLNIPQDGTYQVLVKYPAVSGATTSAPYTVTHSAGTTNTTVNQTTNAGTWVSLGSFSFTQATPAKVVLSDNAAGTVVADAVKLVRDNTADAAADAAERKAIDYAYDPNGNLRTITDNSPGAAIDNYDITYTGLNQVDTVTENAGSTSKHTTHYTYDPNGNPDSRTHDTTQDTYTYNPRDLLSQVTNAASTPGSKTTSFTYTPRSQRLHEGKANGNTVDYQYFLDGLLQHQLENKPGGTLVSEHTLGYDPNGNRTGDTSKTMNADNHAALIQRVQTVTYDPRDRIATLTKTDPTSSVTVDSESYVHDANDNVISQTLTGTPPTSFTYDRNRLQTAVTGTTTASYNYDPWGRLDTVTSGGQVQQRYTYDGFDRIAQQTKPNPSGTGTTTSRYTYDPLDRTSSQIDNAGQTGEKTTTFNYLGLSGDVVDEKISGQLQRSYQYSPWGERLSQTKHNTGGTTEDTFYGYDPHTSVEVLTDQNGDTKATYGYTAYGQNDNQSFTGVDKPDPQDPTKQPYNFYRYTAKRFDPASGTYDMGFRDYDPGLNRFLTRDMYNGALADLNLATDPFTSNRYAFAGGNPISNVELDGHIPAGCDAQCTRDYAAAANAAAQARALADTANNTPTETRAGRGGPPAASDAIPGNAGTDTMCEKLHACPLKLDDKAERLGLCGLSPELLQAALTNQQGHPALPTECLTEQMGLTILPLANGGFVLMPTPTPGILRSEGGGSGAGDSGGEAGRESGPLEPIPLDPLKRPPLRMLHPESSLDEGSLDFWRRKSTAEIIDSLSPGSPEALRVKADGTIMNGNTRISILMERGVDVNRLPREPYP
jgi:RHS repeat-associated protein